jgi:glycolate oxidase iron-sulfur subunit
LLSSVPGVQLVEVPEAEICCGSAGVYNITQPDMARDLQRRKVGNILSTDAEMVATGNIGCITQIQAGLAAQSKIGVAHTMQLLDWAYSGTFPGPM